MPNIKSAIKRVKTIKTKTSENSMVKSAYKTAIRNFNAAVEEGNKEKATELGARAVYPVITDNCALNKSVLEKKYEKWQKVMSEACKQCERAVVPICYPPTSLEEVLKKDFDKVIVFAERSTEITLKQYLTQNPIKKGEKVLAIIGPEGGFSQKEFDYFRGKNLPLVSLGDLILKAETAVIMALGNIVYEY